MATHVNRSNPISAVILAAGLSSRMGKLKPLLPFGRTTVLEHCIGLFQECGIKDVVVVTGHRHAETKKVARQAGAQTVYNKHFKKGMYTSIRAGALALRKKSKGFFLLPVDIPVIRTGTIRLVLEAFQEQQPLVTYPLFAGKRGHPPLISAHLIPVIKKTVDPAGGMRSILQQVEKEDRSAICSVQVADANIHADMDTQDDYAHACQLLSQRGYPTLEECQVIINRIHPMDERIRAHAQVVGETAAALCAAVNDFGKQQLDPLLCRVGGCLHDIAKGESEHDKTGSRWLAALGFPRVAEIIATHKELPPPKNGRISEEEIVYIADKMAKHDQLITIEERFGDKMELFKNNPEALKAVNRRFKQAKTIASRVEKAMGKPLSSVLHAAASKAR